MIWLLGEPEDVDALWLATALTAAGAPVEIVLPEELLVGAALTVRVATTRAGAALRLADGRELHEGGAALILNRLVDLPVPLSGSATDDGYRIEEWRAAVAAWLRTMGCPVLNPPRAATLAGPLLPAPVWRSLARAHGLPARPWDSSGLEALTGDDQPGHVICVDGHCVDPGGLLSPAATAALAAMAAHTGTPLLGATFTATGELVDATVRPALARFGPELVGAVLRCAGMATR